jgi:TolA-binding protein
MTSGDGVRARQLYREVAQAFPQDTVAPEMTKRLGTA